MCTSNTNNIHSTCVIAYWCVGIFGCIPAPPLCDGIASPLVLKPSGQPWHHFTPSIYGSSQARRATLADGLDDVVAAGVHHERFLPTLLDTGHSPTEGDDAEGVHQERFLPPVLDIGHLLAEGAEGVVQDLAFSCDVSSIRSHKN